jgi:hypothetical protein
MSLLDINRSTHPPLDEPQSTPLLSPPYARRDVREGRRGRCRAAALSEPTSLIIRGALSGVPRFLWYIEWADLACDQVPTRPRYLGPLK